MKEFKNSSFAILQILLTLLGITAIIFTLIWVLKFINIVSAIITKHLEVNWWKYLVMVILIYFFLTIIKEFLDHSNRTDINSVQKTKQAFIESLREFLITLVANIVGVFIICILFGCIALVAYYF